MTEQRLIGAKMARAVCELAQEGQIDYKGLGAGDRLSQTSCRTAQSFLGDICKTQTSRKAVVQVS